MANSTKYQKFFAEHFQDRWLNFDCFEKYFSETLCSITPESFYREEQKWTDEKNRLLHDQKNLAFKNYRSFVSTAECSNKIRASFDEIETKLDAISLVIPDLQEAMATCLDVTRATTQQRKEINISIAKHPQLLEVLELPQLIDTSIRNNFFDEGLELHNFVLNLSVKYNDIEIIQKIRRDADMCIKNMEEVLLKQLQSQINLTNCLKNVGLLRRIGTYNENQLKTKFLHLRTQWFKASIRNIAKDEAQYYICKMIDCYRVNLFDIITQYRSVFIEDKNNSLIFNAWLHQQIKDFIELLYINLPLCSGTVLDSVIAQSMYFGMSLGRVGADFRGLLVPIFQKNILNTCYAAIDNATARVKESKHEIMEIKNKSTGGLKLIKITPLAQYTNSMLSMLNELRHCSPNSLNTAITKRLEGSLADVLQTLVEILRADGTFKDDVCNCVVLEMLPLLDKSINTLFSTIPNVYNQPKSTSRATAKLKRSLSLPKLHEILEDFISKPTQIMLGNLDLEDVPDNVENYDNMEDILDNVQNYDNMEDIQDNVQNEGDLEDIQDSAQNEDDCNSKCAQENTNIKRENSEVVQTGSGDTQGGDCDDETSKQNLITRADEACRPNQGVAKDGSSVSQDGNQSKEDEILKADPEEEIVDINHSKPLQETAQITESQPLNENQEYRDSENNMNEI